MEAFDGSLGRRAVDRSWRAVMKQQLEMFADAPPHVDWDREVQELINLLVEAVLTLPDSDRRRVLDQAIAPFFEALLTLKKVPGIGLIRMTLLGSGYLDYAHRLSPPMGWRNEETNHGAPDIPNAGAESEETPDVA
jgi:hypothetical protein